jgi:hypothetical protein
MLPNWFQQFALVSDILIKQSHGVQRERGRRGRVWKTGSNSFKGFVTWNRETSGKAAMGRAEEGRGEVHINY